MKFLRSFFDVIAKLPLVGPHSRFEASLLLHGAKPVGLFVDFKYHAHIREQETELVKRTRANISDLTEAVSKGELISYTFEAPGKHPAVDHETHYLFAKPDKARELYGLAALLEIDHLGSTNHDIPYQDYGDLLGYSRADQWLFTKGGYQCLPQPLRAAFSSSHDFRQRCRVSGELGNMPWDIAP